MSDTPIAKTKYPRADAIAVARELCAVLKPVAARIIVAGSLRRQRPMVGDVEILYIPFQAPVTRLRQTDLLDSLPPEFINTTDPVIGELVDPTSALPRPMKPRAVSGIPTELASLLGEVMPFRTRARKRFSKTPGCLIWTREIAETMSLSRPQQILIKRAQQQVGDKSR